MKHYGIDVSAERRSTLPVWDIEYESKFIYSETTDTLYYGSDVGWVTVSGGGGGTSSHSALTELDYASANHTGFAPTVHSHTESNISDLDKYTQAEVDNLITTISGKLDDHDELNNLDYASAGHTGFQPSGDYVIGSELTSTSGILQSQIDDKSDTIHTHTESDITDLDKYTQSEVDTISGTLNTKINGKDNYQSWTFQVDGVDKDDITSGDKLNFVGGDNITITRSADDQITISGSDGVTNHSQLNELDFASAGHTGFASSNDLTTVSGDLQTNINGKSDIGHNHNDDYYTETELNNGQLDNRYYIESEVNTISGSLSAEIDSDISTHTSNVDAHHAESHNVASHSDTTATGAELNELTGSGDTSLHKHDSRYFTESEVDTISGTLQTDIDTRAVSGGAEHDGFSDFVAHEHVDHSGITITAGTGLTGGGNITSNVPLDVNVGITNDKIVQMDDLDAASGDYAKLTASGIEGRSIAEILSDLDTDNRYRDVYKTIYIDAAEMIPATTNGSLQGTKEYGTNDVDKDYLAFDGGVIEERAQFTYSFPDNWDRLTIKAKFIWSSDTGSTTGDTVEWGIRAVSGGNDDTIDTAFGTPQIISDALLADNGTKRQITAATSAITVLGSPAVGDEIQFEVYRNTDGTDDMAEDAWLFRVAIQIKLSGAIVAY